MQNSKVKSGWYLKSLVDGTNIAVTDNNLPNIIYVEGTIHGLPTYCPPNPPLTSIPKFAPNKMKTFVTVGEKQTYDSAFITVDTINDREILKYIIEIPNGKNVKVNDVDGITKYYAYDKPNDEWIEINFAPDMSEYATKEYVHEAIAGDMSEFIQALQLIPVSDELVNGNGGDGDG